MTAQFFLVIIKKLSSRKHGQPYDSLAQLAEHLTFNQGVRGSNPRWVTKRKQIRTCPHRGRVRICRFLGRTRPGEGPEGTHAREKYPETMAEFRRIRAERSPRLGPPRFPALFLPAKMRASAGPAGWSGPLIGRDPPDECKSFRTGTIRYGRPGNTGLARGPPPCCAICVKGTAAPVIWEICRRLRLDSIIIRIRKKSRRKESAPPVRQDAFRFYRRFSRKEHASSSRMVMGVGFSSTLENISSFSQIFFVPLPTLRLNAE